ncbi:hypothetical protein BJ508DRAFT_337232 [Ascobolus immersus RN42]|uniref:Uncharacterized protein n=1 Tax=Ascobolus immersus RN42 TaxID=1160509 RepID=A0A3N4ITA4_ASCIM|nr:hypothetical protein BJ508DRAFT_337232 [Ascobolus immersus RN42]
MANEGELPAHIASTSLTRPYWLAFLEEMYQNGNALPALAEFRTPETETPSPEETPQGPPQPGTFEWYSQQLHLPPHLRKDTPKAGSTAMICHTGLTNYGSGRERQTNPLKEAKKMMKKLRKVQKKMPDTAWKVEPEERMGTVVHKNWISMRTTSTERNEAGKEELRRVKSLSMLGEKELEAGWIEAFDAGIGIKGEIPEEIDPSWCGGNGWM